MRTRSSVGSTGDTNKDRDAASEQDLSKIFVALRLTGLHHSPGRAIWGLRERVREGEAWWGLAALIDRSYVPAGIGERFIADDRGRRVAIFCRRVCVDVRPLHQHAPHARGAGR